MLLKSLAKIISLILHPVFLTIYGLFFLAIEASLLWKIFLSASFTIPQIFTAFLLNKRKFHDLEFKNTTQRVKLLFINSALYFSEIYLLKSFVSAIIFKYFLIISAILFVAGLITLFWKISLHLIGSGAFFALLLKLALLKIIALDFIALPIFAFLLLVFARKFLKAHNFSQIFSGFLLGIAMMIFL